jgi:hypothetical protein
VSPEDAGRYRLVSVHIRRLWRKTVDGLWLACVVEINDELVLVTVWPV